MRILDATTRAAIAAAAANQTAKLEALRAPFVAAGSVTVRALSSGGTNRGTGTYPGWTLLTTTPRKLALQGPPAAYSHFSEVTPTRFVFAAGGVDIFELDGGVTFPGAFTSGMRVNLSDPSAAGGPTRLEVTADASLPLTGVPAWAAGATVDAIFEVTGTTHMGSPADPTDSGVPFNRSTMRLSYSNIATDGESRIIVASTGGHGDYSGNEVTAIDLSADTPVWEPRRARYGSPTENVAYYRTTPTVEPTARHTYNSVQWSSTLNRLMLHATPVAYGGSAVSSAHTNGFNLGTNDFDPAGSYADGMQASCRDSNDNCWARAGGALTQLWKWTPGTDTWSLIATHPGIVEKQMAHDSARDQLFGLSWGNGGGSLTGRNCHVYRSGGTTQTAITLNPIGGSIYPAGNAVQQWDADASASWPNGIGGTSAGGADCAMDYDPTTDRFYWTDGLSGRIFYIVPNSGSTWDFGILATTGTLPPQSYSHARMKIFQFGAMPFAVLMPSGHQNLYALRLA